ncbi:MAG TPA: DUF2837 family protein, partial [Candidatus Baltobacteraceae bacterium]
MTDLWSSQLVLAMLLNALVQCIAIGAYAARLAGVQSGRIATSISLFNLFVTTSRLANLVYAPMLGTISDRAAGEVRAVAHVAQSVVTPDAIYHQLETQLRLIV